MDRSIERVVWPIAVVQISLVPDLAVRPERCVKRNACNVREVSFYFSVVWLSVSVCMFMSPSFTAIGNRLT